MTKATQPPAALTLESVDAEYVAKCARRDEIEASIGPFRAALAKAADEAEAARVRALDARKALDEARGGDAWFELKKDIAVLATIRGRLQAREARAVKRADAAKGVN